MARTSRPRLRQILIVVYVVVAALPLGGIAVLRIYESALVRQTESALVAQGAFVAAAYRAALARLAPAAWAAPEYGRALPHADRARAQERWRPQPATLDLAESPVLPPPPAAEPGSGPDPAAAVAGASITALLADAQLVTLAGIRVLDPDGVVVASTGTELGGSLANRPEVLRALRGEHVSLLRRRDTLGPLPALSSISRGASLRVFVAMPITDASRVLGAVVLARTPRTITESLYAQRRLLAGAAVTIVCAVLLLASFTSLTISRPVRALIAQARRAVQGERGAVTPLAQPVTQEIDELSRALAGMARALEEREDYIRSFASHVSHEFKTPLAAMRGAIELLRDHETEMPPAQRERFLVNIDADAKRLERLVAELMALARADTLRPAAGERADLGAVCAALRERLQDRDGPVLRVSDLPEGDGVAMAAPTLDSILSNLVDNAWQHGASEVRIQGAPARDGDGSDGGRVLRIRVSDDGPGVSSANAARLFEPFFTTARETGGTGLGLTVVRAVLEAHGGSIDIVPGDIGPGGGGLTLELALPAARGGRVGARRALSSSQREPAAGGPPEDPPPHR